MEEFAMEWRSKFDWKFPSRPFQFFFSSLLARVL